MRIRLHRPDGKILEVRPDAISIETPDASHLMNGNTIIRVDGENHGVMETVEQIDALIKAVKE